jgi:signal peptidase II
MVLVGDLVSKAFAEQSLLPPGTPRRILGDFFRLTLTHNDGGALGIPTGRVGFLVLIVVSAFLIVGLGLFYRRLPPESSTPAVGLGLLIGGASGNLWSRVMVDRGVVDFIDIGLGSLRFWTFNLADTGITLGAALLGWWFWRTEGEKRGDAKGPGQEFHG